MTDNLCEVINSHQLLCRGIKDKLPVFSAENSVPVIVKVYGSGKTEALCPFLAGGCTVPRCNPESKIGIGTSYELAEDNFSSCIYCSR